MHFSTALLVGLGARIILDIITPPPEPSQRDTMLIGIWQGAAIHHASTRYPDLLFIVALGIAAWLFVDFTLMPDISRTATILLGLALGTFCAGLLSQLEGGFRHRRHAKRHEHREAGHYAPLKRPHVSAQPTKNASGGDPSSSSSRRPWGEGMSDITAPSLDTSSDMIDHKPNMSPLEREVASLRTRASLADTERRRYKEEKKWALSQGNVARAEQMAWQVKRYTTLMQSFHREADALIIEGVRS
jgi:hypothetical protein